MMSYRRIIQRQTDDTGHVFYVAWHPELTGCVSQGDTPQEAEEMLGEARCLYFEALKSAGLEPPPAQIWSGGLLPPMEFL